MGRDTKEDLKLTNEAALDLLRGMLKYSADEFEEGVTEYLEAMRAERKAKNQLAKALRELAKAHKKKTKALGKIQPEYNFLTGEEFVEPLINGEYVTMKIIMGILESFDHREYNAIIERLKQGGKRE